SVPAQVVAEVVVKGQGRSGSKELAGALGTWITERTADPSHLSPFPASLSVADREVLAVAQAMAADYILTDDRALRREASRHQLVCLRVAEVVGLLKAQGIIPLVKPV